MYNLRSKRFRLVSGQRPRNGIFAFDLARNETRAVLTLVPRSLLLNRTETLATLVTVCKD